jgi:arsenite-transporting ATPase
MKTLVVSTDAAHSLADAFDVPTPRPGAEPPELETGLALAQVDTRVRLERSWGEITAYLREVLDTVGVDPIQAEELMALPGADEVLALLEVRDRVRSGRWDLVVVDCAPTGETLRLLALPEALGWYVERLFPLERRVVTSLRPLLGRVAGVPMPRDRVFDAVERLHAELQEAREVLSAAGTSVRLVLTPEAVVVAEARRTLTALSLYGYRVDGVVANRVFPAGGADPWRARWVAAQADRLAEIEATFAPLAVHRAAYQDGEPIGPDALGAFAAELYGGMDPAASPVGAEPLRVERSTDGFVLSVALPFADRTETDLVRVGDELVVTVGASRRVLALPSALRRCTVVGAAMRDGRLRVRFEPDPAQWRSM